MPSGAALASLCQAALPQAFASSQGASWGLSAESFAAALERSIHKHFGANLPSASQLQVYIASLRLEDLALASACAEGHAAAWEFFVSAYRPYLRSAAAAILRCPAESPAARELGDSLFADLYGLTGEARSRSLFLYFHGRSSLRTWLRTVLAQRHIDAIRAARRFTSLDDQDHGNDTAGPLAIPAASTPISDPHRERYLAIFHRMLEVALNLLDQRDKERLRLYYAEDQTLAEIGRILGEHESSVSRHLDRTRREIRHNVEQALRRGAVGANGGPQDALSDAQIALCFEYASQDSPVDFDKIFPAASAAPQGPKGKAP